MYESGRTHRVELNRAAFDVIDLGVADGLFAECVRILRATHPPDAPPIGKGLVEGGGAVVWIGNKKVDGTTIGGKQIKKPRGLQTKPGTITAIVGYGFPGRFVELGTVNDRAEPFLSPAVFSELPGVQVEVSQAMARRLRKERDPRAVARFG